MMKSGSAVDHVQGPSFLVVGGFQLNQIKMNDISEVSGFRKLTSSTNVFSGLFEANVAFQVLSRGDDMFAHTAKSESARELLVRRVSEGLMTSHECAPGCRISELFVGTSGSPDSEEVSELESESEDDEEVANTELTARHEKPPSSRANVLASSFRDSEQACEIRPSTMAQARAGG